MAKNGATKVTIDGGIGIAGLLTITFVILKSLGYLSWSWWLVFAPLWISIGLSVLFIGILAIIALIVYLASN